MEASPETEPASKTLEEIAAARAEYEAATDRMTVIIKYPWLAKILNNTK